MVNGERERERERERELRIFLQINIFYFWFIILAFPLADTNDTSIAKCERSLSNEEDRRSIEINIIRIPEYVALFCFASRRSMPWRQLTDRPQNVPSERQRMINDNDRAERDRHVRCIWATCAAWTCPRDRGEQPGPWTRSSSSRTLFSAWCNNQRPFNPRAQ